MPKLLIEIVNHSMVLYGKPKTLLWIYVHPNMPAGLTMYRSIIIFIHLLEQQPYSKYFHGRTFVVHTLGGFYPALSLLLNTDH